MDDFEHQLVTLLPNLRRFAISLCKSTDFADDLVQITCQKALSSRESFQAGTRLDAWLFTILRNSWMDHVRSASNRHPKTDIDEVFDLVGDDGESKAESRLMLKSVMAQVSELPDEQREVLVLSCVEEMPYRQIAEVLGLPIGTVMSRLARARKKIADALGPDLE